MVHDFPWLGWEPIAEPLRFPPCLQWVGVVIECAPVGTWQWPIPPTLFGCEGRLVQRQSYGHRFSMVFIAAFLVATPTWAQEARWKELDAQVDQLQKQGKNKEALPVAEEALHVAEATFGAERANTATAPNRLGTIYEDQGKYAEAEPLYKRSLAIREKALGPDHPDVARSLNSLANLYEDQGKYAEAEPLFKRSLAIREKALGSDHPDVANSLNDLADLYEDQGKYAEAEPLHTILTG
jgi:tetratricopeptide (TPR) repeat protein